MVEVAEAARRLPFFALSIQITMQPVSMMTPIGGMTRPAPIRLSGGVCALMPSSISKTHTSFIILYNGKCIPKHL